MYTSIEEPLRLTRGYLMLSKTRAGCCLHNNQHFVQIVRKAIFMLLKMADCGLDEHPNKYKYVFLYSLMLLLFL